MTGLVQCVPNFSEGRDPSVVNSIIQSVRETSGVRLADWSADRDHNRLVVTFLAPPEAIRMAALASAAVAIDRIDLRTHSGVHPRLGALDVLPLVPLAGMTLAGCAEIAQSIGVELAARFGLPVFLYEAASSDCRSLPFVRKSAFHTLQPDYGPGAPHPTAGASVVGAREPLIAYNVNLAAADLSAARTIARELRVHPEMPGIRALGLRLLSRGITQVSMNITQPAAVPLLALLCYIERRACELGTCVIESEVIGGLTGEAAFRIIADTLQAPALKPGQILWESAQ